MSYRSSGYVIVTPHGGHSHITPVATSNTSHIMSRKHSRSSSLPPVRWSSPTRGCVSVHGSRDSPVRMRSPSPSLAAAPPPWVESLHPVRYSSSPSRGYSQFSPNPRETPSPEPGDIRAATGTLPTPSTGTDASDSIANSEAGRLLAQEKLLRVAAERSAAEADKRCKELVAEAKRAAELHERNMRDQAAAFEHVKRLAAESSSAFSASSARAAAAEAKAKAAVPSSTYDSALKALSIRLEEEKALRAAAEAKLAANEKQLSKLTVACARSEAALAAREEQVAEERRLRAVSEIALTAAEAESKKERRSRAESLSSAAAKELNALREEKGLRSTAETALANARSELDSMIETKKALEKELRNERCLRLEAESRANASTVDVEVRHSATRARAEAAEAALLAPQNELKSLAGSLWSLSQRLGGKTVENTSKEATSAQAALTAVSAAVDGLLTDSSALCRHLSGGESSEHKISALTAELQEKEMQLEEVICKLTVSDAAVRQMQHLLSAESGEVLQGDTVADALKKGLEKVRDSHAALLAQSQREEDVLRSQLEASRAELSDTQATVLALQDELTALRISSGSGNSYHDGQIEALKERVSAETSAAAALKAKLSELQNTTNRLELDHRSCDKEMRRLRDALRAAALERPSRHQLDEVSAKLLRLREGEARIVAAEALSTAIMAVVGKSELGGPMVVARDILEKLSAARAAAAALGGSTIASEQLAKRASAAIQSASTLEAALAQRELTTKALMSRARDHIDKLVAVIDVLAAKDGVASAAFTVPPPISLSLEPLSVPPIPVVNIDVSTAVDARHSEHQKRLSPVDRADSYRGTPPVEVNDDESGSPPPSWDPSASSLQRTAARRTTTPEIRLPEPTISHEPPPSASLPLTDDQIRQFGARSPRSPARSVRSARSSVAPAPPSRHAAPSVHAGGLAVVSAKNPTNYATAGTAFEQSLRNSSVTLPAEVEALLTAVGSSPQTQSPVAPQGDYPLRVQISPSLDASAAPGVPSKPPQLPSKSSSATGAPLRIHLGGTWASATSPPPTRTPVSSVRRPWSTVKASSTKDASGATPKRSGLGLAHAVAADATSIPGTVRPVTATRKTVAPKSGRPTPKS